jgi:hypothetical protein
MVPVDMPADGQATVVLDALDTVAALGLDMAEADGRVAR